jgi:hypothetical protein
METLDAELEKEIKTKYTLIEIEELDYHRGLIPLFSGRITVYSDAYTLKGKQTKAKKLAYDAFTSYEDQRLRRYDYYNRFGMAYTEFLYPGSPDLGLSVDITYANIPDFEDFKHDYEKYYDTKTIRTAYKYLTELYDQYNDALYEAEQAIRKYQKELENEIWEA